MRLVTYRDPTGERLGVVVGQEVFRGSDALPGAPRSMADLLRDTKGLAYLMANSAEVKIAGTPVPLDSVEIVAPVPRPGKIVAIGRNYAEHANEEGVTAPTEPLIFAKWSTSVVGPGAAVTWDRADTAQVDYEAELAVVIGRRTRAVSERDALSHVLGYTCLNDVSARDLQFADGQWTRGKSLDTFCPMGPALVTRDEIPDPQDLRIRCLVNGEVRQDATTRSMYSSVAAIISFCSRFFTLEPGDVIATGTPSGVGAFRKPPSYLSDGDRVDVEIERIGVLSNPCRSQAVAGVS